MKEEIVLQFATDYDLQNKEITDFKYCEKENQVRIVLKNIDSSDYDFFCFDFSTGALSFSMPFNKETAVPSQNA